VRLQGQLKLSDSLQRSVSLGELSSDTGLGSRSVSTLSLASDADMIDEPDSLSRDKLERELMVAYSRRRPLVRPLDLTQATSMRRHHFIQPFVH